ncbi:MAG: DNA-deoxyinosine glycosylase [Pseudobdellovibrionaceae bacterium]
MELDKQTRAFPPIIPTVPRILILGTMPGVKSLEKNQYYGHPQNQFWKFMGDIFGAGKDLPYEERVRILKNKGVAVWDVLLSCQRKGSMDADIRNPIVNDFSAFFKSYSSIERVVFDSLTAEKIYTRHVLPDLKKELIYKRVPSPSPAYARMRYEEKLELWRSALVLESCL